MSENYECNQTSSLQIKKYFLSLMMMKLFFSLLGTRYFPQEKSPTAIKNTLARCQVRIMVFPNILL